MSDLFTGGWRQGSVFAAELTATYHDLSSSNGGAEPTQVEYSEWVVCTQDCDLRAASVNSRNSIIELRPVFDKELPQDWGIRSHKCLLDAHHYVNADSPRAYVTPALLSNFEAARKPLLKPSRALAFTTWLGLRYDRPAVPDHLVPLARDVAKRCGSKSGRPTAQQIHDVLMQFDESTEPPQVSLFAIVTDDADQDAVRRWLADAALRVGSNLGVVAATQVGTKRETSLYLIETSFSADLSKLTWAGEDPVGAI